VTVRILIFNRSILLQNNRIYEIVLKVMTLDHRFNLLKPEKLVLRMQFPRDRVHENLRSSRRQRGRRRGGRRRRRNRCGSHEQKLGFNLSSEYHIRVERI